MSQYHRAHDGTFVQLFGVLLVRRTTGCAKWFKVWAADINDIPEAIGGYMLHHYSIAGVRINGETIGVNQ